MAGFAQARSAKFAGLVGDPKFFDIEVATTPGSEQIIFSQIVPASEKWNLSQIYFNVCQNCEIKLFIDAILIGSGYVTESNLNFFLSFFPARPILTGETLSVRVRQNAGTSSKTARLHLQLTKEQT